MDVFFLSLFREAGDFPLTYAGFKDTLGRPTGTPSSHVTVKRRRGTMSLSASPSPARAGHYEFGDYKRQCPGASPAMVTDTSQCIHDLVIILGELGMLDVYCDVLYHVFSPPSECEGAHVFTIINLPYDGIVVLFDYAMALFQGEELFQA
eukprot:1652714-Rhodomonas_salina.1